MMNRIPTGGVTDTIIRAMEKAGDLTDVLVVGQDKNGVIYWFGSDNTSVATVNWMLDMYKHWMLDPATKWGTEDEDS